MSRVPFALAALVLAFGFAAPAEAQRIQNRPATSAVTPSAPEADQAQDHLRDIDRRRAVMRVRLDEALIVRLDTPAQTIVIGNPSIADAMVHDGRTLIITGKSFGTTNLIAVDRNGAIIAERQIEVQQPWQSIVTVQRGAEMESYSCTPNCRRTPIIGDTNTFFSEVIGQTQSRNGLANAR
jgi:Flp pilus assembly secretin CpaC